MMRVAVLEAEVVGHRHDISCKYDDGECSNGIDRKVAELFLDAECYLHRIGHEESSNRNSFGIGRYSIYQLDGLRVKNQTAEIHRYACGTGIAVHRVIAAGDNARVEKFAAFVRSLRATYTLVYDLTKNASVPVNFNKLEKELENELKLGESS